MLEASRLSQALKEMKHYKLDLLDSAKQDGTKVENL
jgi:hypothetical protein